MKHKLEISPSEMHEDALEASTAVYNMIMYYGMCRNKEETLAVPMWEEKFFGSMQEAQKLRDEIGNLEEGRRKLADITVQALYELLYSYDESVDGLCKKKGAFK